MILSKIKVIVFDLDGTLYEDKHHLTHFAEMIRDNLSPKLHENFMIECNNAILGNHLLKIGRIYDAPKDLILISDSKKIIHAYKWDGTCLKKKLLKNLYPGEIEIDIKKIISVEDPLWLIASIGMHYGLDEITSHYVFLQERKYIMSPEFIMHPVDELKETLEYLKTKIKLILLTNSQELSSEAIIKKLGIHHVFSEKIFEGNKPCKTVETFEQIQKKFNLSFNEILSVGDNYMNEILPAKLLGCKTIYIDTYKIRKIKDADYVVQSVSEMINIIKNVGVTTNFDKYF